jgi:Asp-tRNA(Asn)/Glu-tRNA(Gln) amidotransferase A subunit family amidase
MIHCRCISPISTLSPPTRGGLLAGVPCGFSAGLPVGMQIMGPPLGEPRFSVWAPPTRHHHEWHTVRPEIEKGA